MDKRVYMISMGDYSDYTVGGLYWSSVELDQGSIAAYVKDMISDQFPDLPSSIAEEAIALGSSYRRDNCIAEYFLGVEPDFEMKDEEKLDEWHKWKRKQRHLFNGKNMNLSDFLVKKGVLTPIEYKEIHLDEGWVNSDA